MALVSLESKLRQDANDSVNQSTSTLNESSTTLTYNSRLYQMHIDGRETQPFTTDFGRQISPSRFTRPFLPLANYYAQSSADTGIFGIRNDRLDSDNQPYVIRNIGERWNEDKFQIPDVPFGLSTVGSKLTPILLNQFGWVANRDVPTFTSRFNADVKRLSVFADKNSLYTENQKKLQGRNPFTSVTTIKYGQTKVDSGNKLIDGLVSATPLGEYFSLNPQVYNPDSVYSAPGVPGMMINRMGMTGINITDTIEDAVGIVANISLRALELAAPKAVNLVSRRIGDFAKEKFGTDKGSDILLDNLRIGKVKGSNQKTKTLRETLNTKFGKKDQTIVERANSIGDKLKKANAFRKEAGLLFANEKGAAGKAKLINLDPAAFEDVAADRVNLIPYGKDEYKGVGYEKLDWIPFKFFDVVGNKPIVFRAILSGITDTFNPEYSSERYVGRPDNVHVYQGTTREISFTFDVYPKSDAELITLWEKLNHLAGLTYPHYTAPDSTGGQAMISPYTKLTLGDMYRNAPGYISSLTYTVQDNGTWEVDFAKLPKYVQVSCTFVYIGDRLLEAGENAKHYDLPFVPDTVYQNKSAVFVDQVAGAVVDAAFSSEKSISDTMQKAFPNILGAAGK